jgi:D-amino-acid dehydrogenase
MTRFTAYADIDGTNINPITKRKSALINNAKKFFPNDYDEERAGHWVGLRPVSADDCPIIGPSTKYSNLFYIVGHGSRGVAQSLGSGKLLFNLINKLDAPEGMFYENYDPARFDL